MRSVNLFPGLAVITALLFIGCIKESPDILDTLNSSSMNIPVIVNVENAYTLSLNATDFSLTRTDSLNFRADSIAITLSLANNSSGTGEITLLSADSSVIFREPLQENKVIVRSEVIRKIPVAAHIWLKNFTGNISFIAASLGDD